MIKLIDAILEINPNAEVSIRGNDYDKITWHNIEPIDKSIIDAKVSELENAKADEETAVANKKASGKQKLKDLGLDDDEIKALMGA